MKIKYRLPNKKHDTCIVISKMTQKQVGAIIAFLEHQGVYDFEYLGTVR